MTSPKVCLEAQALHGALAGWQCQERAVQTQPSLLPAQPETGSARPERNRASPKRYSKTARHQAGHTAQGTGPPNTLGRWGRTLLLVLWTEHSRRMYRMLSDNESLNNKWQVPSPWFSCPSHLSSVYRKEALVLCMETQCHSNSRSLLLLLTRGSSGSATRDKVSKKCYSLFCNWPISVNVDESHTYHDNINHHSKWGLGMVICFITRTASYVWFPLAKQRLHQTCQRNHKSSN